MNEKAYEGCSRELKGERGKRRRRKEEDMNKRKARKEMRKKGKIQKAGE